MKPEEAPGWSNPRRGAIWTCGCEGRWDAKMLLELEPGRSSCGTDREESEGEMELLRPRAR